MLLVLLYEQTANKQNLNIVCCVSHEIVCSATYLQGLLIVPTTELYAFISLPTRLLYIVIYVSVCIYMHMLYHIYIMRC